MYSYGGYTCVCFVLCVVLGSQHSVFNGQARVFIGGYKNNSGVYKQFNGLIQGKICGRVDMWHVAG